MSKYYLDIGNSFIKLAEKAEAGWNILHHFRNESVEKFGEYIAEMENIDTIVVSSVRADVMYHLEKYVESGKILKIKSSLIPPYFLDYETPKTLGIDRFLVCLGASESTPNNVVVIDAGSACTIDLMTSDKIFRGGVIMPGFKQYHQSMSLTLPELPEVDNHIPSKWPGKSTESSIQWGINGGYIMSIVAFINKYRENLDPLDIYLTGGDANYILHHLEDQLPLKYRPNLIFDGMAQFENL